MNSQGHFQITDTSAWKNASPIVRFGLLNVYQGAIMKTMGLIIHLVCKLQILALYLKITLESVSSSQNGVNQVAKYFTNAFLFADFFSIRSQSSVKKTIFYMISSYYLLLVGLGLTLAYKALRKRDISSKFQNFWALWIYIHPLMIMLPTLSFNSAILNDIINHSFNEKPIMVLSGLIHVCVLVFLCFSEILLGNSMNSTNFLSIKNNLLQRFELFEKFSLVMIIYLIPNHNTKSWIVICVGIVLALTKLVYVLRCLPYYEVSVLKQETLLDCLTVALACLTLLAKVIEDSYTNALSLILIIWTMISPLIAKATISRLNKVLSDLINSQPEEVQFSHLPQKLYLYEDYLSMRSHINLDAPTFDFHNLILLGREKAISTKNKGKTNHFDFKNKEHFKVYSLNFLKENIDKSWSLRVAYIRHLIKYKYYAQAVYGIEQASKALLSISKQLSLSFLAVELETHLTSKYKKINKDNLNMLRYIEMNNIYKDFVKLILEQTKTQMSFWDAYLSPKINFKTLINISNKVEDKKVEMKKFWKAYQLCTEETFIAPYLTYSLYLETVNCLPTQSFDILNSYFRKVLCQEKDYDKDKLTNDTLYGSQNVSVEISGSKENMGTVLNCSPSLTKIFGFERKGILGSQVSILLPDCLKDHHNGFLLKHYETGKKSFLDTTRETLAMTASGYIIPIFLHIRLNPYLGNTISYISMMRPKKDTRNYLIVLPDGSIDSSTEEISQELQIPLNQKINILDICPGFRLIHDITNRIGAGAVLTNIDGMKAVSFGQKVKRRNVYSDFPQDQGPPYSRRTRVDLSVRSTIGSFSQYVNTRFIREESILQTFIDKNIEEYQGSGLISDDMIEEIYNRYKEDGEELTFTNYRASSKLSRSWCLDSNHNLPDPVKAAKTKANVHVEILHYGSTWLKVVRIENFVRLKSISSLTKTSFIARTKEDLSEGDFSEACERIPIICKPKSEISEYRGSCSLVRITEQENTKLVPELAQNGLSIKLNPKRNGSKKRNLTLFESEFSRRSIMKNDTYLSVDTLNNRKLSFKADIVTLRTSERGELNAGLSEKEDLVEVYKVKPLQKTKKCGKEKFKNLQEAASYYSNSQGKHQMARYRAYENALEVKPRSLIINFFITAFIVLMTVIVGLLIAQMIMADHTYQDISEKHDVLHFNDKRTDALISLNYFVRTWQGINKGLLGSMPPNVTLDPLVDDLENSILLSVDTLQEYSHDLLVDISLIKAVFQQEFFAKNIKIYELDENGHPGYFDLDDTFSGLAKITSQALQITSDTDSGDSSQILKNTMAANYVLFNSYNDLINQCSKATNTILADVNYIVDKYKDSLWTITSIIIAIMAMFLLISVSMIVQINKNVYFFSGFFFKVSDHDATLAHESLKKFHKVLGAEHQAEDLLASGQQIEQGWKQVKTNDLMKITPKTIHYNNYKAYNTFLVLRLWPLIFCMLALVSVFTLKQLAGVNSIGTLVSHILAALTNTLNQNMMASLITEIVVANASTMAKNMPIMTVFDTVINTFAESNNLITTFMDSTGQIEDQYNELLFNVSCEATFPSNVSAFREACDNLTDGLGSTGTIDLNNLIYQDGKNYISNFMVSPRTFQDQTEFFMKRDDVFLNLFKVAREINVEFWQRACDDFWEFLAVESDYVVLLGSLVLASIIIISTLSFPVSLLKVNEKDYEMKRMIKLIPIPIILKNRWLKTYLTKTSKKTLDLINKSG